MLKLAQTVIVVLVPESGDSIQVMKAGLMEIADIFAVNKCDRPEADKLVRELVTLVGMNPHDEKSWIIPVHKTEGVRNVGIVELIRSVEAHQDFLTTSSARESKALDFIRNEIEDILIEKLSISLDSMLSTASGQEILAKVLSRELDPYSAAELISYS